MKSQRDYSEGNSMEYQKNDVIKKKNSKLSGHLCMHAQLFSTKKLVIQEMAGDD